MRPGVLFRSLAAILIGCASAFAQSPSFSMINLDTFDIREIYITSVNVAAWGSDALGDRILSAGTAINIPLPTRSREQCLFDVSVVTNRDARIERRSVNLCEEDRLILMAGGLRTRAEADALASVQVQELTAGRDVIAQRLRRTSDVSPIVTAELRSSLNRLDNQVAAWAGRLSQTAATDPVADPRVTEFLFATNRSPAQEVAGTFGFARMNSLNLGAARVRVPEHHLVGRLELPKQGYTIWGITFGGENLDPQKHFQVQSVSALERDKWLSLAKEASQGSEALVFVHGYNVSFQDALLRTSQIMYDIQYKGLVVLFSWPSRGSTLDYRYDIESALHARKHFIDLLHILRHEAGIQKVNVLAHSMGNLVVVDSLAGAASTASPPVINELIMAAPDVDRDQFTQAVESLRKVTRGMTLYASSADKALVASRALANAPRAGDLFGNQPVLASGVDSIDVSVLGSEILGLNHSSFAERRSLMNDIRLLLVHGIRPPNLRLSEIRGTPAQRPVFWRFTD